MATPVLLVQQILSGLVGTPMLPQGAQVQCTNSTDVGSNSTSFNTNANPTIPGSMLSLNALKDWLKLFLIGGFFEMCRRFLMQAYTTVYNWFFITAVFMEDDPSYDWIMLWLSKQPSWGNARDLEITARSFGLKSDAVLVPGEDDGEVNGRLLSYIPSYSASHSFWYKRRWCRVTRLQRDGGSWYKTKDEYLELCILSWDHQPLNSLLLEAKKLYKEAQKDAISIFTSDSDGWRHVTTRRKRPLSSIVLDPGIKDLLLEDAQDFLECKSWYSARGIPFRRGYLLYGAPGSGKTSIIHSLAGELGLNIFIVSLSRSGMDDNALNELITQLPEQCIALMEDIDAAFTSKLNRDDDNDSKPPQLGAMQERTSKISLSGLLNALDGIGAQEGRLLFATTNKYNSLDPALTRPGRMDLHIEFKLASKHQARELYRCFFLPDSELEEAYKESLVVSKKRKETQEIGEKDLISLETASNASDSEKTAISSSPPSPVKEIVNLISLDDDELEKKPPGDSGKSEVSVPSTSSEHRLRKFPKLPKDEVSRLAAEFGDMLPEREFSMASLQGYLMSYKTRPQQAIKDFKAWMEKEKREREERKAQDALKEKQRLEKEEKQKKEKEEKEKEEKQKKEKEMEEKHKEKQEKQEKHAKENST